MSNKVELQIAFIIDSWGQRLSARELAELRSDLEELVRRVRATQTGESR